MMEDFNRINAVIDANLDSASRNASAALAAAQKAYTPDQKPYATGTYVGDGGTQSIYLGFRPSFLIISGMSTASSVSIVYRAISYFGVTGGNRMKNKCTITDTGFDVLPQPEDQVAYPDLNHEGIVYDYIAFR